MITRILVLSLLFLSTCFAQEGDRPGEVESQPSFPIPPAPALSASEELKTFKLPKGFRIELVASEPLVEEPVALAFDPDGRIWVVEMRGFMPNVDGKGEDQPIGRISILEDTDGDGKMDKKTVFADGLIMPRAICLVRDGVLVAEPPKLWYMRDTNGDGKADEKIEVAKDYGSRSSPEHTANGLLWALDNWIYSANYTFRFRSLEEDWKREGTAFRGQWGISQDDFGRLFFNSNQDQLRCDLVPSAYLARNPNLRNPRGLNFQVISDQSTWPIRVNPGVNRGYRSDQLRKDGTLATFTAACAPLIYRGDNFPSEFEGNAFVCEPAGNLVKRDILTEKNGEITARRAYDKSEFLASTDERFRPINLYNGPDGAMYVVDMYHGIIQHRVYVTSYLRQQILSRKLDQPLHKGRIFRVVYDGGKLDPAPHLSKAPSADLVNQLTNANGWWRDIAQRLLVERADASSAAALRAMSISTSSRLARIHALWTLDGMGSLDRDTVLASLNSSDPKIRAAAIRLAEPSLKTHDGWTLLPKLVEMTRTDRDPDVQLQLAFTLGQTTAPLAEEGMLTIARNSSANPLVRDALISGLVVRELEFLQRLLADDEWREEKPGRSELLTGLARCVFAEHKAGRVARLIALASEQTGTLNWRARAILAGVIGDAPPKGRGRQLSYRPKVLLLPEKPAGLDALLKSSDRQVRARTAEISNLITWPGQPGYVAPPPVVPLTAEEQARFDAGKTLFEATCAQCHQPHGLGQEGLAPPLVDSEWALGSDHRLARIALNGVHGPISVKGRTYNLDMPSFGSALTDEQIAAVLTYIRRSWEHEAAPVKRETVKEARAQTAKREEAWTQSELLKVP